MFRDAAVRLHCPKDCDSSCPQCVLDFDQRFEAGVLDRKAALSVLTPDWLDMLKIPDALCYLGDSSMVSFLALCRVCCGKVPMQQRSRPGCLLMARPMRLISPPQHAGSWPIVWQPCRAR